MKPTDITFLRRQAEHCIALSRATFDLTIASRLRTMADEFHARASELEGEMGPLRAHATGRNDSPNGSMDRH
jgi:hypothetical protein